ncbi:conjugal transfer protein TraG N-terminal domain-containing protein, partial [Desulfurobacterium sp.]
MKKKLFVFLFMLLFPSLVCAATPADTIYTWGYGDILAKALHGVADVVGSGGFETIFKIFLALSLFSSFISLIFSIGRRVDYFSVFKMWIFGSMVFTLLFTVKIPVAVEDVSGFSQVVNNVPWLIGKPLAFFSQIEEKMGEIVEQAFFPTTSFIGYNQLGPITPLAMVAGEVQATMPVDPYLYKSINNYVKDCVIPDILDGSKSLITLQSSHTLWTDLGNTNPARFTVIYDSSNPDGTVYDCPSAYGVLDSRVKVYAANDGLDVLSNSLGFISSSIVASSLGLANDYFMSYSASAQDAILQGIAINQMKSGYREWAIAAGVNPDALSYSLSTATEQLKQTSLAKAITGAKYLPMAKGVGTAFFVAMLPFMIVISLFSGPRAFKVVLTVYVWFLLWHIGEVVLNAFLLTSAQNQLSAIAAGGPTLMSAANVAAASQDKIIAFSSFYWLIPTISFGLASGAAYAFSSVASGIMGAASGAAAAGAAEAAKGSASFGNLAYGNVSSNNIDWLHRENMGTETRMDLLNYSMNGRRSISTAFANRMNSGGTFKEQIANQSVSAFGLPGIPGKDKFIDGEAVFGNKGVTIHGKTAGGWNVDGLIDKNGLFTGIMKTGNREVQYDHGTPIKEKV